MKVQNLSKAGKTISTSIGQIKFDSNGIADVPDDEFASQLLEMDGYTSTDAEPKFNEEPEAPEPDDSAGEEETSEPVEDGDDVEGDENEASDDSEDDEEENNDELFGELNSMSVPQLRKYAKDNGIDLQGASKKDEIIPVILGASN